MIDRYILIISMVTISLIYVISIIKFLFKLNGRCMSDSEIGTLITLSVMVIILTVFMGIVIGC